MKKLEEIEKLAWRLIERDTTRNRDFEDYERMYHNDWDLPPELAVKQWIFSVLNTEPANKINAATRVIARLEPSIKVHPLYSNEESKNWANRLEKVLEWNVMMASKRKPTAVWWDLTVSSLLYNMIAARVIDLDYQIKKYKMFGGDTKRMESARKRGRFVVNVVNPKDVHVVMSDIMEEGVLHIQRKPVINVVNEYGEYLCKDLMKKTAEIDRYQYTVCVYDYMDYEMRTVWVADSDYGGGIKSVLIEPTENEYPFMPWVVNGGASTIEDEEEHKYRPLLYTILKAGQWDLANIADSIITSRAIALSGTPVLKEEGNVQGMQTEIDYDDPLQMAKVPAGNTLNVLTPPMLDAKMLEVRETLRQKMAGTIPDVLVTLQPMQGEPYATFATRMGSAVGALGMYIRSVENGLADICLRMTQWAHYTKSALMSFGRTRYDSGMQYVVNWDELEPESVYIEVTMRPDTPIDKIGNINAAAIAINSLGMSKETALEEIGIEDPQEELRRRMLEQLIEHEVNMRLERERQMMAQELQQTAQMQSQQAIPQPGSQQQMEQLNGIRSLTGAQGIPGIEGQGFNPFMGGMPPNMVMPEATPEFQRGGEQ